MKTLLKISDFGAGRQGSMQNNHHKGGVFTVEKPLNTGESKTQQGSLFAEILEAAFEAERLSKAPQNGAQFLHSNTQTNNSMKFDKPGKLYENTLNSPATGDILKNVVPLVKNRFEETLFSKEVYASEAKAVSLLHELWA